MQTSRTTTRTIVAASTAALVAATGLVAFAGQAGSSAAQSRQAGHRLTDEARSELPAVRAEQLRALKPREHLGLRPAAEATGLDAALRDLQTLTRTESGNVYRLDGVYSAGSALTSARPEACSDMLAQAWQRLGHYSDGYERYLLTLPPCNTP